MINQNGVIALVLKLHEKFSDAKGIVNLTAIAKSYGAIIREDGELADNEDGNCITIGSTICISVNAKHSNGRKRFTIAHELGHIILDLPSNHSSTGIGKVRPVEETLCDLFAGELLLPKLIFSKIVNSKIVSMENAQKIAEHFEVSLTCAVLRIPIVANESCVAVLSDNGRIRYSVLSESLRDLGTFIDYSKPLERRCGIFKLNNDTSSFDAEVDPAYWFDRYNPKSILSVFEESRLIPQSGEVLTLLSVEVVEEDEEEGQSLRPLIGELTFKKRSRAE